MSEEERKRKQRENSRKYYQIHKKEILERQKNYVRKRYHEDAEFREKKRKLNKKYMEKYPEKVRMIKRKSQFKYMNKKRINGEIPLTKNMIIENLEQELKKYKNIVSYLEKEINLLEEDILKNGDMCNIIRLDTLKNILKEVKNGK